MQKESYPLRWPYIVLGILAALLLIAYALTYSQLPNGSKYRWTEDVSLNLFTELGGALIVIFVVERVVRKQEKRDKEDRRSIALKSLRRPLLRQLQLFKNMFMAAIGNAPNKHEAFQMDMFDDVFYDILRFLNLTARSTYVGNGAWINVITAECEIFIEEIHRILSRYSQYMEPEEMNLLQAAVDAEFTYDMRWLQMVLSGFEGYDKPYVFDGMVRTEIFTEYANTIQGLVNAYNSLTEAENKQISLNAYSYENIPVLDP